MTTKLRHARNDTLQRDIPTGRYWLEVSYEKKKRIPFLFMVFILIHPVSIPLEPLPANLGQEARFTQDRLPVHCSVHIEHRCQARGPGVQSRPATSFHVPRESKSRVNLTLAKICTETFGTNQGLLLVLAVCSEERNICFLIVFGSWLVISLSS